MNIRNILRQFGFSENEANVYLASLELGLSSAQDIAKKAGIKRTTAYSVLDYLVQRGIMSKTEVKGKTRFLVEPPEKLLNIIGDVYTKFSEMLPELHAVYNIKQTKPKITFYEGELAVQNIYDDTLKEKPEEILEWNTNKFFERSTVDQTYIEKRVGLNIKAKRMASIGSLWDKRHKARDKDELSETVILPKDKFDLDIEVNIYNDKIAFLNYEENMSVIIESKAIADAMKKVYELSWIGAKTIEVK